MSANELLIKIYKFPGILVTKIFFSKFCALVPYNSKLIELLSIFLILIFFSWENIYINSSKQYPLKVISISSKKENKRIQENLRNKRKGKKNQ